MVPAGCVTNWSPDVRLPTSREDLTRLQTRLENQLRAVRAALSLLDQGAPGRVPLTPFTGRSKPTAASRASAQAAGAGRYHADRPCRYGHPPVRYTATKACVECARNAQWANEQSWRDFNAHAPAGLTGVEGDAWRQARKAELRELRERGLA